MPTITSTAMTGQGPVGPATQDQPKHLDTTDSPKQTIPEETKPARSQERPIEEKIRREIAWREKVRAIEAREQAIKAREADIEQASAWKSRLTQDPYGVLLDAGLTADQAAALLLNQPNPEDQKLQVLQKQIKDLKDSQDQSQQKFEALQKQQYEEAKKQIRNDVLMLVDSDVSFETVKAMGAHDAVVELIEQTFSDTGNLMSIEDATKEVEEYLIEEAMKFVQLKKIQSKLTPRQQEPTPQPQKQQLQKQPMNTLSNRMVQSTTSTRSEQDRKQRAILAFQGKLNT